MAKSKTVKRWRPSKKAYAGLERELVEQRHKHERELDALSEISDKLRSELRTAERTLRDERLGHARTLDKLEQAHKPKPFFTRLRMVLFP